MKQHFSKYADERLLRFMLVGTANSLLGMGIMFSCYYLLGVGYWPATAANYAVTGVLAYFLNRDFTFRVGRGDAAMPARFALNYAVSYALAYGFARPAIGLLLEAERVEGPLHDHLSMLLGMLLFSTVNYFGQRLFVYRTAGEREER